MQHRNTSSRGFTVIELVVSITITAALVALALPSLASGRETAHRVECMSNLRQIGITTRIYTDENHGKFPQFFYT